MKKIYIAPETNVYKINVISSLLVASLDNDNAVTIKDVETNEDDFIDPSRDGNNHSNVWDNAW